TKNLRITTNDAVNKGDASATRILKKGSAATVGGEERGFSVAALAKQFGGKLERLAKYNKWIFSGVKPADVKDPRFKGYWNFYHNRMTPEGKYF
ncbi:hypothetical protein F441_19357, partial [Phytophthora nicotianae CJ01A1]